MFCKTTFTSTLTNIHVTPYFKNINVTFHTSTTWDTPRMTSVPWWVVRSWSPNTTRPMDLLQMYKGTQLKICWFIIVITNPTSHICQTIKSKCYENLMKLYVICRSGQKYMLYTVSFVWSLNSNGSSSCHRDFQVSSGRPPGKFKIYNLTLWLHK